ncbi:MAG: LemA family protein [Lachnospiraceae bacterium]|nr:LemA family protein [Lachnospiraceae bacterium]
MNGTVIAVIAAIVVVLLLVYIIKIYNGLVVLKNRVENQDAQVDVQLKRRADLIPNLIETTKGYANYEKSTLTAVTELRNKMVNASNTGEAYQANVELNKELARIMVISENYPELKANANFLKLQDELSDTEEKIAKARQFYNDVVTKYNTQIMLFPKSIFAKMLGFKKNALLEATENEKESVKIGADTFQF